MSAVAVTLKVGLPDEMRVAAASLYLEAFGGKLGPILGRGPRAEAFLARHFRPSQALIAVDEKGALLGLAGFHDQSGGLVGGDFADMAAAYGRVGALWRWPLLALFERSPEAGQLLMDGVVVAASARGQGVGSVLLDGLQDMARDAGFREIRLDVVDSNPRARALYERCGFVASGEDSIGPLRHIFGFQRSVTMIKCLR